MLKYLLLAFALVACTSEVSTPAPDAMDCERNIKGECKIPGDAGNELPRIDAPDAQQACVPTDAPSEASTLPQCSDACKGYHYPYEVCGVYYWDVCTDPNLRCLSSASR